jgi:hypothetical protein
VIVEGRGVNLIAFDPAVDFTVQTRLRDQRRADGVGELLAGAACPGGR